jgi:uncharacterized protein YjbJ (UPF0337 family)
MEKLQNQVQGAKGRAKEKIGALTGQDALKNEGKKDRRESALKSVATSIKDAEGHVKDVVDNS